MFNVARKHHLLVAIFLLVTVMTTTTTTAIDPDHPLSQHLKNLHRQAGKDTIKTQDHRAIKDFRKRFETHRLALLQQQQEEQEEAAAAAAERRRVVQDNYK